MKTETILIHNFKGVAAATVPVLALPSLASDCRAEWLRLTLVSFIIDWFDKRDVISSRLNKLSRSS